MWYCIFLYASQEWTNKQWMDEWMNGYMDGWMGAFESAVLTSSSRGAMELSAYMQSFSADSGRLSFNLEARNMHTAPRSCK